MGSFSSTSAKHSFDISGSGNSIWIMNGAKFNVSGILNETLERVVDSFQKLLSQNNAVIVVNIMIILSVIFLAILLLHLKYYYQQRLAKTHCGKHPYVNGVVWSTSNRASSEESLISKKGTLLPK